MRGVGFHPDCPAAEYHADCAERPSLSSSIAKIIVDETPKKAWLAHPRLNPNFQSADDDAKFDLGQAVHDFLASGGKRVRTIPNFKDYRTAAAQTERDNLRAAGMVPLLTHQAEAVEAIVATTTAAMERRGIELGAQECVMIAEDRGVLLRAMLDSWNAPWITDFKVSGINLANDGAVGNHLVDMHYDLRAWFYTRVAELTFPEWAGRIKYRWLFLEKDEPFGMRIIEADNTQIEMGRRKAEHAIGVWQDCMASGRWPHLEHLPRTVPYPSYKETSWLEREGAEGFIQAPRPLLPGMEKDYNV
jgi:hypothetical protein